MPLQDSLMAFLCDPAGTVTQVLRDDFNLESRLFPGQPWNLLLDSASLNKAMRFFSTLIQHQVAADWELNVRLSDEVTPLQFSGGCIDTHVLIVAATNTDTANNYFEDEILAINNDQANLIRSLIKEKSILQRQKTSQDVILEDADKLQEIFLNDTAKLNNELVTLQRELAKANHQLEQKQHLLENIMETIPDVLYTIDLEKKKLLFSNRSIYEMLGYASDRDVESGTVFFEDLLHLENLEQLPKRLEEIRQAKDEVVIETEYRLKDVNGSWHWFRSRDMVFERNADGKPATILGVAQDINIYKLMQEKLWNLSTRDALTGLNNRTFFDGEFERLQKSNQFPVSIMMVDINDLKIVNDELGHSAGDELLRGAAEVFSKVFRGDDVIARVGGDEFAALLPNTNADIIKHVLDRLDNLIQKHNENVGELFALRLAIGYATADKPGQLEEALKLADKNMYTDKEKSKLNQAARQNRLKEDIDARND